jgi:hypothetical protein
VQTIQEYISAARTLLQDTTPAPRYSDADFQLALELAFDEVYRIRPDIMGNTPQPSIFGAPGTDKVPVPRGYQATFLYYMCGHVQLRDQEDTQDARASIFLNKFTSQLLTTAS